MSAMSDIDVRAKERVVAKLHEQTNANNVLAREVFHPTKEAEQASIARQAAVRFNQLATYAQLVFDHCDHIDAIAASMAAKPEGADDARS